MKRFVLKPGLKDVDYNDFDFLDDVDRIVDICKARGIVINAIVAEHAWVQYSLDMCAGWMMLPKSDDEVFEIVSRWCLIKER